MNSAQADVQQYKLIHNNEGIVSRVTKSFLWIKPINDQENDSIEEYSVMWKDINFMPQRTVQDLRDYDEIKVNSTKLRFSMVEINGKKSILSAWMIGNRPTISEEDSKIQKYLRNYVANEHALSPSNLLKLPAKDVKSDQLSAKSVLVDTSSSCYYVDNTGNDA